jgi:Xaa-Pro aminopeptidase
MDTLTPDHPAAAAAIPFDAKLLDSLMEEARLDVLLVTSKHNVQYMLGGHRALFFDYMDAMGVSRYLPVLIYVKGAPDKAAYIGHRTERNQHELKKFWVAETAANSWGSVDAIEKAVAYLQRIGLDQARIGIEFSYLPYDSASTLQATVPPARISDARGILDILRGRKSPAELDMMREASERVIDSMKAVIADLKPGMTKQQVADALKLEEVSRGLVFEYCLITAGADLNRAPSGQVVQQGDILSIDSGGSYRGYIGDLARMAIVGEPDAELVDLLGEIETVQQAAFKLITAGLMGRDIYAAAGEALATVRHGNQLDFVAHGVGLVTHEVPRLSNRAPSPYPDTDAHLPLQAGMVVSVETTLRHATRGFIKLEDTVAVLEDGHEVFANTLRGWNCAGGNAG